MRDYIELKTGKSRRKKNTDLSEADGTTWFDNGSGDARLGQLTASMESDGSTRQALET